MGKEKIKEIYNKAEIIPSNLLKAIVVYNYCLKIGIPIDVKDISRHYNIDNTEILLFNDNKDIEYFFKIFK